LERAEDGEDVAWLRQARKKKLHYRPLEDSLTDSAANKIRIVFLETVCHEFA